MDVQKLNWLLFTTYLCGFLNSVWLVPIVKHYLKQATCTHKNTNTYVEEVAATCEKVRVTCLSCGKVLSNKIEC